MVLLLSVRVVWVKDTEMQSYACLSEISFGQLVQQLLLWHCCIYLLLKNAWRLLILYCLSYELLLVDCQLLQGGSACLSCCLLLLLEEEKSFPFFCVAARSIINSYVVISTEEKESEGRWRVTFNKIPLPRRWITVVVLIIPVL